MRKMKTILIKISIFLLGEYSVSPDGVVSRLARAGETHVDQDTDWEDADQAGDHQVATDRLPAVLRMRVKMIK